MGEEKTIITSAGFVFGLERVLDELVNTNGYEAKIGNTTVIYQGTVEDTISGKREVFLVTRKIK